MKATDQQIYWSNKHKATVDPKAWKLRQEALFE